MEHRQNRKMQTKSFVQYNHPIQAAPVYFNKHTKLVQLKSTKSYGREKISFTLFFRSLEFYCIHSSLYSIDSFPFPHTEAIHSAIENCKFSLTGINVAYTTANRIFYCYIHFLQGKRHDLVYAWLFVMCLRK